MNSKQYEELCRYFLADKLGISVEEIQSVKIQNPKWPGLPEYKHQIDLYWETCDKLTLYLNIANAKWRTSDKVDQPEIMLLQQVKQEVGAHKAMMLTNIEFTAGAKAAAQNKRIALHIVRPNPKLDYSFLPQQKASSIQAKLQEMATEAAKPIYLHQEVYKAFDLANMQPKPLAPLLKRPIQATGTGYSTKIVGGHPTKIIRDTSNRGDVSKGGGRTTKSGGSGFRKQK